jgi:hypothetical protein
MGAIGDRLDSVTALGVGGLIYGLTIVAGFGLVQALRRL